MGSHDVEIEQIEYDSRLIKGNALFVAVKGSVHDGYDFVDEAKRRGAVAVMGERTELEGIETYVRVPEVRKALAHVAACFYGFPGLKLNACGVTGTNGKTTTCYLIRSILRARNKTTGLVTSFQYDTGKDVFDAVRTTPESLDLQRLLFLMRNNYCVNAVIEVSSHALVQHRVDNINFRVAVYTNISRDHLDYHKSMKEYVKTKAQLLDRLEGPLSYAVINLDVPEFRTMFGDFSSSYISYSVGDTSADVYCSAYETHADRTVFDLVTPMGNRTVTLRLPGMFNLSNGIAAAAAGLASGVDLDNVVVGLEEADPVPGRFQPVKQGQPFSLYIDFAHTPDAIRRLCESVRVMTEGRLLLLFGCGGDRDPGKRPLMGEAATTMADYVVVTSDNPRSEQAEAIIDDIKPGLKGKNHDIIPDRAEAIETILKHASAGDVVLLAGKGAERYQEIGGERIPFSDEQSARQVMEKMGYALAEDGVTG